MASTQRKPRVHTRAFTLVELVLTLLVTSILLISLMSVMRILGRAVPQGGDTTEQAMELSSVVDRLRRDVALASDLEKVSADGFSIIVGDRDADGKPETLTYTYDASEQTLLLSVNGGTAFPLANDIARFRVQSRTSPQVIQGPSASQWTSPSRLVSTPFVAGSDDTCHQTELLGLIVTPTLPTNATAWRIARVEFFMTRGLVTPVVTVRVQGLTSTGLPSGTDLQSVTQTPSSVGLLIPTEQTFNFGTMASLTPSQRAAVIVSTSTTANGIEIPTSEPTPSFHSDYIRRSGGGSWQVDADKSLAMTVWVQFLVPVPTPTSISAVDALEVDIATASGIQLSLPLALEAAPEAP